jgi:hypothetical protein
MGADIKVLVDEQSPDIGQGVHGMGQRPPEEIGAGDQVSCPAGGGALRCLLPRLRNPGMTLPPDSSPSPAACARLHALSGWCHAIA